MRVSGNKFLGIALGTAAFAGTSATALAGLSDSDYLNALAKAEAKAERANPSAVNTANRVALRNQASVSQSTIGRSYRVGESWDVAAFAESSTMARRTNEPAKLPHLLPSSQRPGHVGLFHYEVTTADAKGVTVRITQRDPIVDLHVESILIRFDSRLQEVEKTYTFVGDIKAIQVSPDGVHSRISRLELFPLDPVELATAERGQASSLPALPASLATLAGDSLPSATTLSEFRQDDFFGRPVKVLWRPGDPWPAYINTINGTAVLIHAGGAR